VQVKKGKASPYSITERRVPELIPVLSSQPASDVNHKPDRRLPLLSARPAVTPATLKRAATNMSTGTGKGKGKRSIAVRNMPHRYGNSHAISDHTVLPVTRQRRHYRPYSN